MSKEKGFLSENVEELVIEALDKWTPFHGTKELLTDLAFQSGVPLIDNNLLDLVDEEIKIPIREGGDLAADGQYVAAAEKMGEAIAAVANIKGMEEQDEKRLATKLTGFIADLLQTLLKKKAVEA